MMQIVALILAFVVAPPTLAMDGSDLPDPMTCTTIELTKSPHNYPDPPGRLWYRIEHSCPMPIVVNFHWYNGIECRNRAEFWKEHLDGPTRVVEINVDPNQGRREDVRACVDYNPHRPSENYMKTGKILLNVYPNINNTHGRCRWIEPDVFYPECPWDSLTRIRPN